jgi:alpha-L-fucosidase 2
MMLKNNPVIKTSWKDMAWFIPILTLLVSCNQGEFSEEQHMRLWYEQPASAWTEALPMGNGRIGAMMYGSVEREHIQFNEETLWTGEPHDYAQEGAHEYLEEIRTLLFEGKQQEAHELAMQKFMSVPLHQKEYQPFGDLYIEFPGHGSYTAYHRELDLEQAICRTRYEVGETRYEREVFISHPDQVLVVHLTTSGRNRLDCAVWMDAAHQQKKTYQEEGGQVLEVAVAGGALRGMAQLKVRTNGNLEYRGQRLLISDASEATIYMTAATNYVHYKDVSGDPAEQVQSTISAIGNKPYQRIRNDHISDYRSLFDRFDIRFGNPARDTLPTDTRLRMFWNDPDDPAFVAQYVQYGRYLMISSSRSGTRPANLQGIWNDRLNPPWGSKYTTNANTGMNYWPAELTNLSDCHEPLFRLVEECAETGINTAREHYDCNGWVLHHNTDIWRGTAPINHSNHGIWVGGSGWLSLHLWDHYLFTHDTVFLEQRAYPVMREAARFYSEFLVEDLGTGWLISTPSNSPEIGGLVAGPTMDHQIIRSLFRACIDASGILDADEDFAASLGALIPKIAPNQVGRHGQLQEWMEDIDDPENHHRHVSHLWGFYPGWEINRDQTPELVDAARQSLLFRGDEGTGWSLAWKINYWARFLEGDRAFDLIRMLFRPVESNSENYMGGGGSYINLFDAHPPFQIDGNFGGTAGIVEMLIQSHLGRIDLLPALPSALPDGSISGVRARGGFELSFAWDDGILTEVEVLSDAGQDCRIQYGEKTVEFPTEKGQKIRLDGGLNMLNP